VTRLAPKEYTRCKLRAGGDVGVNRGRVIVRARDDEGTSVDAEAARFALGYVPGTAIDIETAVDGFDGDEPAGPRRVAGRRVEFTYVVTNVGTENLFHLRVRDRLFGEIRCPEERLDVGDMIVCSVSRTAVIGHYRSAAVAVARRHGEKVKDRDPTYWHVRNTARVSRLRVEVTVDGWDADRPPGPTVAAGDRVEFRYRVTNAGNSALWSIEVRDPNVPSSKIRCLSSTNLLPNETVVCRARRPAVSGQYAANVVVVAWDNDGTRIEESDPVHYVGR
jgi:hypothetical protein